VGVPWRGCVRLGGSMKNIGDQEVGVPWTSCV
jgi:hypothetical protein